MRSLAMAGLLLLRFAACNKNKQQAPDTVFPVITWQVPVNGQQFTPGVYSHQQQYH